MSTFTSSLTSAGPSRGIVSRMSVNRLPRLSFSYLYQNALPLSVGPRSEPTSSLLWHRRTPFERLLAARGLCGRVDAVPHLLLARRQLLRRGRRERGHPYRDGETERRKPASTSLAPLVSRSPSSCSGARVSSRLRSETCSPAADTRSRRRRPGSEAAGVVFRHRPLDRVEQILDAPAVPLRQNQSSESAGISSTGLPDRSAP